MAKKKFDPKAKAKRQKVMLAVGGVILLGLLVIQVPKTMKMMKGQSQSASSSSPPPATSTTAGSNPLAPPSLDGSTGATGSSGTASGSSAATSADGVTDPSNPLTPNAGQLVSFSKFKSKDPFHQQIALGCQSDPVSGAPATCTSAPSSTTKKSAATRATGTKLTAGASKPGAVKPQTATISVNGAASTVTIGNLFPAGTPVFTLVSLTTNAARIGIAGGSYENGAPTVTLRKGKTVTLVNTADGARYALRLVAVK
jgi:hypothetical protein